LNSSSSGLRIFDDFFKAEDLIEADKIQTKFLWLNWPFRLGQNMLLVLGLKLGLDQVHSGLYGIFYILLAFVLYSGAAAA
jgi:hypothetical protein